MDSLKQQFHYQTVWMLFDDSHANFGHARNFLLFENPFGNHDVYLGISTNRAGASDARSFGTQYYTMFAPKAGSSEFTPGNDYTSEPTPSQPSQPTTPSQPSQVSDLAADRLGQAKASDSNKPSEMAPKDNGQSPVGQALPDTGESSNLLVLGAAIMTAIAGIALLVFKRRKI